MVLVFILINGLKLLSDHPPNKLSNAFSSSNPFFYKAATTCCLENPIYISLFILD